MLCAVVASSVLWALLISSKMRVSTGLVFSSGFILYFLLVCIFNCSVKAYFTKQKVFKVIFGTESIFILDFLILFPDPLGGPSEETRKFDH